MSTKGLHHTFVKRYSENILKSLQDFGSPQYIYSQRILSKNCKKILETPHAYGLTVRYAMKANSTGSIIRIISSHGIHIDASSFNEVKRSVVSKVPYNHILYTSQEILFGNDRKELEDYILKGLFVNVCSLEQYRHLSPFLKENQGKFEGIYIRVHPGVGSGASQTRNTGDKFSCFGVHLGRDLKTLIQICTEDNVKIIGLHVHIGSGGDPETWKSNIDREIGFLKEYDLKDVRSINFGGGFRVARMEEEANKEADVQFLGEYAKNKLEEFYRVTGRKLSMEIEPGTFIVANVGFIATHVIDEKDTDGFKFIILDGGMELNSRPVLYGSKHPFYLISKKKNGRSNSEDENDNEEEEEEETDLRLVIIGKCCESGDCQTLDDRGHIVPRLFPIKPRIGDVLCIGGVGAYTSSMSPMNYNSHLQAPEILIMEDGSLRLIRKRQTFEQLIKNEIIVDL